MVPRGGGAIAQLVKCLLHMPEDLDSIPSIRVESWT